MSVRARARNTNGITASFLVHISLPICHFVVIWCFCFVSFSAQRLVFVWFSASIYFSARLLPIHQNDLMRALSVCFVVVRSFVLLRLEFCEKFTLLQLHQSPDDHRYDSISVSIVYRDAHAMWPFQCYDFDCDVWSKW